MPDFIRALAPYHDYGWFLALLAWSAAAVIGRRTLRDRAEWSWLPWVAWPATLGALLELAAYAWPAESFAPSVGRLPEDLAQGACLAAAAAGLLWSLPVARWQRAIGGLALLGLAVERFWAPDLGATAIVWAATGAAFALGTRRGTPRAVLALAIVALWLSSAGPLAGAVQPRRAVPFGEWSIVWSFAQAVAGVAALLAALRPWFGEKADWREGRPLLLAGAAWLVFGLALAGWMSAGARALFESNAVARTQMAAAMLDKTLLAEVLDQDFQLTNVAPHRRPNDGSILMEATVPRLGSPPALALKHQMAVLELGGLNGAFMTVLTMRNGWMVAFTSERYSKKKIQLQVGLFRPAEEDLDDWQLHRARFMPPLLEWTGRANSVIAARAPLLSDDGRMLGLLHIEYSRSDWVRAQGQTRLQAFLVVALGFGLAVLVALQRAGARERERAQAVASAAVEADQLKSSFLAKVSHELRTPIQSVLGYSDLVRSTVIDPVARGRLKSLRQHGELMLRLVNDLLDLSAIQAGAFRLIEKPTALVEIVTQTVESLRPRAEEKGLALALNVAPAVPTWAEIDGGRVRQVLFNLVGNAVKFTERGRVEVELAHGPGEKEITLVVRDTGPGIAAADLGRLFRAFERLDATAAKEGTGLGLALSAALCRSMGGGITVESVEGEGATFRARFRAPPCEAVLARGSSAGLPPLSGRRILLADDNALVRELFVATLQEAGAQCVAVADGQAALVASQTGNFDAIVLDLSMPRLGGVATAKKLREQHGRDLRILGLSAHAGHSERDDALAAGMDGFLVKPVNLDDLVAALAPASRTRPPVETSRTDLLERLRTQFRSAAAAEGAALAEAVAAGDFELARARAHHLANSASVVRDDWLYAACAAVERAAVAGDAAALRAAWQTCEASLEPWRAARG